MKIPRILIAATGSGSGKTLITCGLLAALKREGKRVAAFKCGPDYIDPMFHQRVLGVPSVNLDTFFTGEAVTQSLFMRAAQGADIAVMEGVMGLYDGLGGIQKEGSSYHLAEVTKTPVLLVINARGMGKSILPVIQGFLDFDEGRLIRGVILNRISGQFYDIIAPEIERVCHVPVLGYLPQQADIHMESRHLGLILPQEIADIRRQIEAVADTLCQTLDMARILALAASAEEAADNISQQDNLPRGDNLPQEEAHAPVKIGIARDEAFCFYYADNLALLERAGAVLVPFSPLHDDALPKGISGLILGGGYPELYAGELSKNVVMRTLLAEKIRGGMPAIAECGGFMYLHETLVDMEGQKYPMAGVIPGTCFYTGKPVRFGYVELQEKEADFLPEGGKIAGHEFHYFDSTSNGNDATATKPASGRSWDCVHKSSTAWMGFVHLYYYANPEYAYRFLGKAADYEQRT